MSIQCNTAGIVCEIGYYLLPMVNTNELPMLGFICNKGHLKICIQSFHPLALYVSCVS